jgi:hypothetical protein
MSVSFACEPEGAVRLGRNFIGIELYEENAQISQERCYQAHLLRCEFKAKNPMKASTRSSDEALNDPIPDEVQFGFDFDAGVGWKAAS